MAQMNEQSIALMKALISVIARNDELRSNISTTLEDGMCKFFSHAALVMIATHSSEVFVQPTNGAVRTLDVAETSAEALIAQLVE